MMEDQNPTEPVDGGPKTRYRMLPVSQLKIDYVHYQRPPVSKTKIQNMFDNYKQAAFGTLLIAERSDGSLWIVDGQQRYLVCKMRNESMVPCSVFSSTGHRHEAEVYTLVNSGETRTPLKPWEIYKACVDYRRDPHYRIDRFLNSLGLKVGNAGGNSSCGLHVVAFPARVIATWNQNEEACKAALRVQNALFGESDSMNVNIHKGLHYLLHFGINLENEADMKKLEETGRRKIVAAISNMQALVGSTATAHDKVCGQAILDLLNKGRRSHKYRLPEKTSVE
jgi:hypothetical protein